MRRPVAATLTALTVVVLVGCAGGEASSTDPTEITVFAAASLQKTFTQLGGQFEAANPGTRVRFNFGGSSDLVAQLQQGARGDVFASADQANMDKAVVAEMISGEPTVFAANSMMIAVPPGNPAEVDSFASLAGPGLNVVVCAPQVPCGAATEVVEEKTGVTLSPVSEESSVTDVLGKVTSGEADAGIVYVTDVKGAGDAVEGIEIAASENATNSYPIAVVAGSDDPDPAAAFKDYVLSAEGQQVLADAGFGAP